MSGTDSAHTRQIKKVVADIGDHKSKNLTLLEDARRYFASMKDNKLTLSTLKEAIEKASPEQKDLAEQNLANVERDIDNQRVERLSRVNDVVNNLLSLTEGHTEDDTLEQSAKSLGTLLLITQGNTGKFALQHQALKPFYKTILSLRLCDAVLNRGNIKHSYLSQYIDSRTRFTGNRHWQQKWLTGIARPLIKAAIFQDVGLQHPSALAILNGKNNEKDPFRLLDEQERKQLLKLNYNYTSDYIENGLGIPGYAGNSKDEREGFFDEETASMNFCLEVITDAFKAKNNIGELVKIPQIYTSFVLSTKKDYTRVSLPKGYMVIEQLAKTGKLNKRIAEEFLSLVGYFPQGLGICYLPVDDSGVPRDTHEYAIVNRLRPEDPTEPHCRVVTRNLAFIRSGKDIVVSKGENLYFQANHKKLKNTNVKRLQEIMSQLSSSYDPEESESIVPRVWEPFDYFADKKHQNLWTKLT